ncbi:hypothetical protein [Nonomuraea cavernae]
MDAALAEPPTAVATRHEGAVSLKVEAWNAEGNTLKQTSTRLFDLR